MIIKDKRKHLLNVAMHLFVKNGFHASPTSMIAKKANLSVGTLFNHFETKAALIEEIYISIKSHIHDTLLHVMVQNDSVYDQLQMMYHKMVLWGLNNPDEFNYLELFEHSPLRDSYRTDASMVMVQEFRSKIYNAIGQDSICNVYPTYSLIYVDHSIHAATRFLLEQDIEDVDGFINKSFDLLWNGFKPKK